MMNLEPRKQQHRRACNLCEAICGLVIELEDGRITSLRGDRDDPLSRGHICPKAVALQDIHTDPDRLKQPVRRTTSGWQAISWDDAFSEVQERIVEIQNRLGRDAVGTYLGNPNVHKYGSILFLPGFLKTLKTRNRFSATSVDQLPHHFNALAMFGHKDLIPVPDVDRTDLLLIFGGNPAVSNGSLMTAPDMKGRLKAIRERGGRVLVFDPRRSETARLADEHHFVRPGTDVFVLAAMLHTLYDEQLEAPGRLATACNNLEHPRQLVAAFSPERVAPICGVEAETVRRLARQFAESESAVCYGRMGVSVTEFGALSHWLINTLNLVTGNLDRAGGAMFPQPAADTLRTSSPGHFGRWSSRHRGLPEFGGELPVSTLAEEILTPGDGQIRALFTVAGNPVLSTPNGRQLERALAELDFMVSIDIYINETTRFADLILPSTVGLEHDHYDLAFHLLAVQNTARYSPALFEPSPGALHDWQILVELESRLADPEDPRAAAFAKEREVRKRIGPRGILDRLLQASPYGLSLAQLEEQPSGIDLGPLEPCLPNRLFTADQKIEVAPNDIVGDFPRLSEQLEKLSSNGTGQHFTLIGRRHVRSNNSWMHNFERLMKGADRCTLLLHPDDAERLGVARGDSVQVRSRVGEITAPVTLSDQIMPGVVSLPHGWGHARDGVELGVAGRSPGVSVNDLTDEQGIDRLSGNAMLNGVPVELSAV